MSRSCVEPAADLSRPRHSFLPSWWWSECAFAGFGVGWSFDPAERFQMVMPAAFRPEVLEGRRSAFGVVVMMIDLQIAAAPTTDDPALEPVDHQRSVDLGRPIPAHMGDRADVFAL